MTGDTVTAPINRRMTGSEWLLLITLSLVWGLVFFLGEVALLELPPLTIVFCRVALAAMALYVVLRLSGLILPATLGAWSAFLVMGALNNAIPFGLIIWGQTTISGGLAAILNATTPVFTILVAHFCTADEKMSLGRFIGVMTGLAGVAVMIGPEALGGLDAATWGQIAVIAAALSYACAGVYGRRFSGQSPMVIACGQLVCSSLLMLPLALFLDRPWTLDPPSILTWAAVLGIALPGTALAYLIYFRLLASAGATNLLLVTILIPVSAVLLGAVFLGERLDPQQLPGIALIVLGLAAIDGRPAQWLRKIRRPQAAVGGEGD